MFTKFFAIIEATIREGLAKKTILGMLIVSTVAMVIAILLFQMDVVQKGLLSPSAGHVHINKNRPATTLLGVTVLDFVWMTVSLAMLFLSVIFGVFTTAGFITSLMEKGTIDLLLSKPVPRWLYVVGRYCGSLLIILVEVTYLVLGLWLCAGISLGVWNATFLLSIPFIVCTFAGVYGLVTLIGILTRSSWFAIILGLAVFFLASIIIPLGQFLNRLLTGDDQGVLTTVADIFHYTIPQAQEVAKTMTNVLLKQPATMMPLVIIALLAMAYVGISSYAFSRKEF